MNVLDEAKEIMEKIGCKKAFAIYGLELNDIAEVRSCNEKGESIELIKDINDLVPTIEKKLTLNPEKPIECPFGSSLSRYLEFSLKDRTITPYDISNKECKKIEDEIRPILEKYNWEIIKK